LANQWACLMGQHIQFNEIALKLIGYKILMENPKKHTGGVGVAGFGEPPKPDFWITEGTPNKPQVHVAFRVDSKKKAEECYSAAVAAGAKDNGKPSSRPHCHEDYYGAFILDPDGHNIKAVFHG
jgi:catechol 2,3-dioxygenase-like lactoylglutathione lyase family enzyme